jgi:sugar phosphate isomerase/epimerase
MHFPENEASRRTFLRSVAVAAAGVTLTPSVLAMEAGGSRPEFNVSLGVFASYEHAKYLRELGYGYIEESVGGFLIPKDGDAGFSKNLGDLQTLKFPIRSYVILLPAELKTVGPNADHEGVLRRTELALKRASACGSKYIVFGSGGARHIPEGFDREKAKAQHIAVTKKMGPLAEKYGITIAVEPLNRSETNFINSLAEGVEIVNAVKNPRVKLLCDIYHMLKEDESPDEIVKFGKHIIHCHIAEKEKRTPPGVKGDDFRPYLGALKEIGYRGGLSIECFQYGDFEKEIKTGITVLKQQLSEV